MHFYQKNTLIYQVQKLAKVIKIGAHWQCGFDRYCSNFKKYSFRVETYVTQRMTSELFCCLLSHKASRHPPRGMLSSNRIWVRYILYIHSYSNSYVGLLGITTIKKCWHPHVGHDCRTSNAPRQHFLLTKNPTASLWSIHLVAHEVVQKAFGAAMQTVFHLQWCICCKSHIYDEIQPNLKNQKIVDKSGSQPRILRAK